MQRELQNVHIIRTGGSAGRSAGSKPPILPKTTRVLRTPDTVKVHTPIGKDFDCGTQQTNAGTSFWLFLLLLF